MGPRCYFAILALSLLASSASPAQMLWKEPQSGGIDAWTWGPGGEQGAPQPPFQFIREKLTGTNPKVEVWDAAGRQWTVKFGSEAYADTFAPRLLNALGYAAEPTYFVAKGSIAGAHGLKRAKYFVSKTGAFHNASFKLHHRGDGPDGKRTWSWVNNPFAGSRQLDGLKIIVMLMSNWDTKDARDGNQSNNKVVHTSSARGDVAWLAVTDWGASLGKSGGLLKRDRWDLRGYATQTPGFVRASPDGELHWDFRGKHGQDITSGVSTEDVRWLVPYLDRITDQELEAGLSASGASAPVAKEYTRLMRQRINELEKVAGAPPLRQAAK